MTESTKFLITIIAAFIGSGLGTTIVAALFKKRFDAQLETHKALLQRSGRIHEKQVDAFLLIHCKLEHALFYLQRAAAAGKLAGEASDAELLKLMSSDLGAASEEFSKHKLLISDSLTKKLDEFFNKMFLAGMDLNFALHPMVINGQQRADFWNQAGQKAYKGIPALLEAIRTEAKAVIYS